MINVSVVQHRTDDQSYFQAIAQDGVLFDQQTHQIEGELRGMGDRMSVDALMTLGWIH